MYDIKCKGRVEHHDAEGGISPGPARYNHKDGFATKGLLEKILNIPIPPTQLPTYSDYEIKRYRLSPPQMPVPDGMEEGDEMFDPNQTEGKSPKSKHKSKRSSGTRKLPRVASSPAVIA